MTTVNVERSAHSVVQVSRSTATVKVQPYRHSIVIERINAPTITVTRSESSVVLGGNDPVVSITRGDPIITLKRDGAPGPAGQGIAVTYTHTQVQTAGEWLINHQLGRYPSVTIVDSAGTVVLGSIDYIDANTIRVSFNFPFSGKAHLN